MSWNEVVVGVVGADGVPGRELGEGVDEADHDELDAEGVDARRWRGTDASPSAPGIF